MRKTLYLPNYQKFIVTRDSVRGRNPGLENIYTRFASFIFANLEKI